ncbi:hypothetical protein SCHPADRAFT_1002124 [Schizopora paradoxa]|uniref:Copper homeostasis protein cutC homolog n=1 Tax=Schizopora paradoxa TaxID=27342 RepID=A0A0H2R4L4_9AGAM|nr:hypothetical protein SCHPADRAFT_1002124 [Schizopora paradoxa]
MAKSSTITLEVCVDSVDSAINALKGGADRLEICANLGVGGGTTPSLGLVKCIENVCDELGKDADLVVMIRPRIGDFVYSANEVLAMKADIEEFAGCRRVKGVVFGALTPTGTVDVEVTRSLASLSGDRGLQVCFHRAFDMLEDQEQALRDLSCVPGITRILTSGGSPQAPSAITVLKNLCVLRSTLTTDSFRMQLMPGSGLNASTLPDILRVLLPLGVRDVHLSGGAWRSGRAQFQKENMGMGAGGKHDWDVWTTAEEKVHAARAICDSLWEENCG